MINFNLQVREYPFNEKSQLEIEKWKVGQHGYGTNWPVVYFIHNDSTHEGYVGETLNAGRRALQHWQKDERKMLNVIHIITDESFNKSVILDLEAFLIKYISADGKYRLQNGNSGLNDFDYFSRKEYENQFQIVWEKLKEMELVQSEIAAIQKSDLFKYSPYKTLTKDQQEVLKGILYYLEGFLKFGTENSIVVEGCAGTGKTILAVFLIKLLFDIANSEMLIEDENDYFDGTIAQSVVQSFHNIKIGFVVPMQSLRKTLKKVFRTIGGLSDDLILSPVDVVDKGPFDLLIIDEAHRLRQRKTLARYPEYDKNNERLGLPKDATELDWILKCSKVQVMFYDKSQSVRPSDISNETFNNLISKHNHMWLKLKSQLRCLGGDDYIQYVKDVLNGDVKTSHGSFENYKIKMFDKVDEMIDEINKLDDKYGLSCTVAGYGWKWVTQGKKDPEERDIKIGKGYIWNRVSEDWINSNRLPYEIGCIHTVQGYDLNYVGVIFGPEIIYNPLTNRIEVIKEKYEDRLGKGVGKDYEALRSYILNIYYTLLTRGMLSAGILSYRSYNRAKN